MFWSLAAKKCPHSCTKMMVARTAMASMVLAGPSSSKPVFRRPAPRPASPSLGAEAANGGNHSSTSSSRGVASSTSTTGVAMSASSSLASGSPLRTMEDARSGAIVGVGIACALLLGFVCALNRSSVLAVIGLVAGVFAFMATLHLHGGGAQVLSSIGAGSRVV